MSNQLTEASFLKDVAEHRMTILHDDGLYRHLRFQKPGYCNLWFDIITWPGYLCFSGDAGCYVFNRLADMMEFFRRDWGKDDGSLFINPGYWGQKVEAVDRCSPVKEYSQQTFIDCVCEEVDNAEASQAVRKAVVKEVLSRADDGEHEAVRSAMEFECEGFRMEDFYEHDVREYSHRFLWCCYALSWAVRQWDGRTKEVAA